MKVNYCRAHLFGEWERLPLEKKIEIAKWVRPFSEWDGYGNNEDMTMRLMVCGGVWRVDLDISTTDALT